MFNRFGDFLEFEEIEVSVDVFGVCIIWNISCKK